MIILDKEQRVHEIVLQYMAATNAHQERSKKFNGYDIVTPERYAEKYQDYFKRVSSELDTTK